MRVLYLSCLLLSVILLDAKPQTSFFGILPITGLTSAQAIAASVAGLGGTALLGGTLGALAATAANSARRRGRRDTDGQADLRAMLEIIAEADTLDCGKRYLCELASMDIKDLNKQERLEVGLFQGKGENDSEAIALFRSALRYGQEGKDLTACGLRYKKCDVGKHAVYKLVRGEDVLDEDEITNLVQGDDILDILDK